MHRVSRLTPEEIPVSQPEAASHLSTIITYPEATHHTPHPTVDAAPVPLLDLARHHAPLQDAFSEAMRCVCKSGAFALGPEVTRLEATLADYCGVPAAVGCASGSDALLLSLMAIDLGPGDEVILPSFTFFATASAVTRLGATPVFADIDPVTFNIDPDAIHRAVTRRTRAIIPVHLYGRCTEMEPILEIAREHQLTVVEDCAQSIGAEYHGQRAGSLGDFGCFSFYPTKNLGGAGDGGMVTIRDERLADRLRKLRGHGMEPRYYHSEIGINSRLDGLQAAFLNVKFPHLETWTAQRIEHARRYAQLFQQSGVDQSVVLPNPADAHNDSRHGERMVWNQYVIRVPDGRRNALRAYLQEQRIGTEVYYPLGLHHQQCFQYLGCDENALPETDRAASEVLALPCFPELTETEQCRVVEAIADFFAHGEPTIPSSHLTRRRRIAPVAP